MKLKLHNDMFWCLTRQKKKACPLFDFNLKNNHDNSSE